MRACLLTGLVLVGCGSWEGPVQLQYLSSVDRSSPLSVAVDDRSTRAQIASDGSTFRVDLDHGGWFGDVDLPTDAEVVDDMIGGEVLAHSTEGLHQLVLAHHVPEADVPLDGVVLARFAGSGPVALVRSDADCALVWTGPDVRVVLPDCGQDLALEADPNAVHAYKVKPDL